MARSTNKYTSLNFNDIYDKKNKFISSSTTTSPLSSPSSSSSRSPSPSHSLSSAKKSYSFSAASTRHGGMLVLSRPSSSHNKPPPLSPSPIIINPNPTPPPSPSLASPSQPDRTARPDSISLRPLGKTGSAFPSLERVNRDPPSPSLSPLPSPVSLSPKSDKFVPPHLRPGFVAAREKKLPAAVDGGGNFRPGSGHGSPTNNRYGEDGRPKSGGGGNDRRTGGFGGGGESELGELNRPRSGGYGYRPRPSG